MRLRFSFFVLLLRQLKLVFFFNCVKQKKATTLMELPGNTPRAAVEEPLLCRYVILNSNRCTHQRYHIHGNYPH